MAYSLFQLSERELEVGIRWTEVHVQRMLSYVRDDPHSIDTDVEYRFEQTITIVIQLIKQCKYNEEWMRCNDLCRREIRFVPRVTVYLGNYEKDEFFKLVITKENEVITIRNEFSMFKQPFMVCSCERLGRDHILASAKGKCTNCYIYGFVRGEDCAICMMDDGKPWITTSCHHMFHDACWYDIPLSRNGVVKCPLCREEQTNVTPL